VTVKLPLAGLPPELSQTIPLVPPDEETDLNVKLPSELSKKTAVTLPVDMLSPFTVRPVTLMPARAPPRVGKLPGLIRG